jgi:hypothetical protein
MRIQTIKDGPKNVSVTVKGFCGGNFSPALILDITKLAAPTVGWKGLRLDSAVWAIQEKMGLYLWWGDKGDSESLLVLPMESRNAMRFDEGIPSPRISDGWEGKVYLSNFKFATVGEKFAAFFVLLDFDKQ